MKVGVSFRGQPQGSPSRVPSPLAGRPLAYGKFAMNEWIKVGNMQKLFIHEFPSFQIPYFSED